MVMITWYSESTTHQHIIHEQTLKIYDIWHIINKIKKNIHFVSEVQ